MKELLAQSGASRGIIILDSLQKLDFTNLEPPHIPGQSNGRSKTEPDIDDVRLQFLLQLHNSTCSNSRPDGDPVIVVSEVRKADFHRKRLGLDDVLGKAHLVYAFPTVFLLEPRDDMSATSDVFPVCLRVAKIRDEGARGDIPLLFHFKVSQFREPDARSTLGDRGQRTAKQPSSTNKRFSGK